jgi:hypothetical protein
MAASSPRDADELVDTTATPFLLAAGWEVAAPQPADTNVNAASTSTETRGTTLTILRPSQPECFPVTQDTLPDASLLPLRDAAVRTPLAVCGDWSSGSCGRVVARSAW